MVVLFCAIVGEDSVVAIEIGNQQPVGVLKKAIKREQGYDFPASTLALYLAKQNGNRNGAWVTTAPPHPDYAPLLRGDEGVEATYLTTDLLLDSTWCIDDHFSGAPKKNAIHVLVKLPDDRSTTICVSRREVTKNGVIKRVLRWLLIAMAILLSIAAIAEGSVGVQEKALAITKDVVTLMSLVASAVDRFYKGMMPSSWDNASTPSSAEI